LFTVPAGAFRPRPKVDSAVLRLTPLAEPLVSPVEQAGFRRLVVGLFGFRRKQMSRGLRELTGWSSTPVNELLETTGIPADARPEVLPPQRFAALLRALVDGGWAVT
jgi:16S rRNA (adenine1518-N6/adenine1519-N6)-dimethyltransferase